MQQNSSKDASLVSGDANRNTKSTNTFKIVAIAASIIALCGIALGIYCMVQLHQKDNQIANLKDQIDNTNGEIVTQKPEEQKPKNDDGSINTDSVLVENLRLIGDIYTKRKYYLGITNLDSGQDTRGKETYIIDIANLGSKDGVKKYNLRTVLDQAESNIIASLPDILAEGTTNATLKTDCQSYKIVAGDPASLSSSVDWTIAADWDNKLPLTIYMACITKNGGELSLGTELYSLDPNTNELIQLTNKSY